MEVTEQPHSRRSTSSKKHKGIRVRVGYVNHRAGLGALKKRREGKMKLQPFNELHFPSKLKI